MLLESDNKNFIYKSPLDILKESEFLFIPTGERYFASKIPGKTVTNETIYNFYVNADNNKPQELKRLIRFLESNNFKQQDGFSNRTYVLHNFYVTICLGNTYNEIHNYLSNNPDVYFKLLHNKTEEEIRIAINVVSTIIFKD